MKFALLLLSIVFPCYFPEAGAVKKEVTSEIEQFQNRYKIKDAFKNVPRIDKSAPRPKDYFTEQVFKIVEIPDIEELSKADSFSGSGSLRVLLKRLVKGIPNVRFSFQGATGQTEVEMKRMKGTTQELISELVERAGYKLSYRKIGKRHLFTIWNYRVMDFTLSLANLSHNYNSSFVDRPTPSSDSEDEDSDESDSSSMSLKTKRDIPSFWTATYVELIAIMKSYDREGESSILLNHNSSVSDMSELDINSKTTFVSIDENTNSLTVRGHFDQLLGVAEYLDTMVHNHAKLVKLRVKVLEVTLNDDSELGLDWNVVGQKVNQIGTSYVSVPFDVAKNFIAISSNDPTKNYSILLNALESQGKVKLLQQPYGITMNNQPSYFRVGDVRQYVKSSKTTLSEGVASTEVTLGKVNEGLTLQILPSVSENDMISLHISSKIVTLNGIRTVAGGNQSSVEATDTSESLYSQTVRMKDNHTLMLGGLRVDSDRNTRESLPKLGKVPILKWFTNRKRRVLEKREIVFIIQASVVYPTVRTKKI